MPMKVVSYNIHFGLGQDGRCDLARALEPLRDVDVVALQEVDSFWDRSGDVDQIEVIRDLMPDHDLAYGPGFEVAKRSGATGEFVRGERRRSGNITLSRYPILSVRNYPLPKFGAAGKLDIQKGLLEVSIDTPVGPLRVYNTHLCHLSEQQRIKQLELMLDIHHSAPIEGPALSGLHHEDESFTSESALAEMPENAILLGDFNFLPIGEAYATVAGSYDRVRWGRVAKRGGFVDAWAAAGHDENIGTGEAVIKGATTLDGRRRIDFCFVSAGLASRVAAAEVWDHHKASDHYPVVVTME